MKMISETVDSYAGGSALPRWDNVISVRCESDHFKVVLDYRDGVDVT